MGGGIIDSEELHHAPQSCKITSKEAGYIKARRKWTDAGRIQQAIARAPTEQSVCCGG